jgi:hypothetical protein
MTTDTSSAPLTDAAEAIANADLEMSDDAIRKGTGRGWLEWVTLLDAADGPAKTHGELAALAKEHIESWWWAHGVAVGYGRIRGLRARNQGSAGFRASASKTIPVPVTRLYDAWADESIRDQWLEPGTVRWRTGQPGKSARLDFVPAGTIISLTFVDKGAEKSSVAVEQDKLETQEEVDPAKAYWKVQLARLAEFLSTPE